MPIGAITNGVHSGFWTAGSELEPLFDRYLGPRWREDPADGEVWQNALQIPGEELWRAHERGRERLVTFTRERLRRQAAEPGATPSEVARAGEMFDPGALTIGFARRFATYKRALLLFKDLDRLVRIVGDRARPVQFVIAGKAHPQDMPGRETIRQLVHATRREELAHRIVFVEDYDIDVARRLVQGVDVWLSNPRRPHEASGTSGMKVAFNGGLNMSVLDGWWCEAYDSALGWAIGQGEEYPDEAYQDAIESSALYDLLEQEVIPAFYDRGADDCPRGWVSRMKTSIAQIAPFFNTHRMVQQYVTSAYLPASSRFARLTDANGQLARELASWKRRLQEGWRDVRVLEVESAENGELRAGGAVAVRVRLSLGSASPEELRVELYTGAIDGRGHIKDGRPFRMQPEDATANGTAWYRGNLPLDTGGRRGYTVRVVPDHPAIAERLEPGLVRWAT